MSSHVAPAPAPTVTADQVDDAAARIAAAIAPTPTQRNDRLSRATGCEVWLKREDLQPVRSYKLRGAFNLISRLSEEDAAAGVVCASAGNHAQGVAFACAALGVHARIYLPRTTPRQKRERVAAIGGDSVDIVIEGDYFDQSSSASLAYARTSGRTLVPPFDAPDVIAGQGTAVREMVAQLGKVPDVLVVPVGGGGLLAGSLAWLRDRHAGVRVIGVEPEGAPSLTAAMTAGHPVDLGEVDPFVDGAAVGRVGDLTFDLIRQEAPQVATIPEGQVCVEMLDLYQEDGIIAEPAGALATAALSSDLGIPAGSVVVCMLSGGNNDVSRYAEVVERALVHEGRKHYFLVDFPQEPGALRHFLDEVLGPDDDITLFEYVKRSNRETGPALVGIELGSPRDLDALIRRMDAGPLRIERLPPGSPVSRFLV
ncbi:threonine ammonia-lyase IlvA [Luteipulveratus mongoliensis]|uniref:L-threonine dehydratase n=1 Tax=Luteipulveratus mongoliensis TaxID=571913 RepID=A0A0K1JLB0_9MICO|nr:threonine ammonia-lyase IlvA [Luteipulveratus mongoliensis]AKU17501.1 threonine dehydratase [Luteipulveratus mongoliensis]